MIERCGRCITGRMVENYGDIYCINCGWRKPGKPSANHLFTINYKYNASVLNLESIVCLGALDLNVKGQRWIKQRLLVQFAMDKYL
jgi:hypothetical protein